MIAAESSMPATTTAAPRIVLDPPSQTARPTRPPYVPLLLVGLGGLFAGVTGPLISTFVPPLVRDALGEHRTAIGAVMAIDNVLLLLLVPWAGAASDRASARGRGRLPIVLSGFVLSAVGMALFPSSARFGIVGLVVAIVFLYSGINIQRSPFQALVADLVPSRYRSLATGSVTFQMCVGAIAFLMLGRMLGMQPAFLIAAGAVLGIAAAFAFGLREPAVSDSSAEATFHSLFDAARSAVRGAVPGMRAIFVASLLLQLTFQTFSTWYALHGTERFGVRPEDVTIGFIAWAIGGVIGALPAGLIGVRIGRRNAMLLGFGLMSLCLVALDRVTNASQTTPLLALASASWTLPTVNAYPLFVEPIPRRSRGVLASLFLLCMALGGAIGDPLNGFLFDLVGGYRPLFLMMAGYTALAFVALLFVPRGAGEADTGPDSNPSTALSR
jgi:maltose/moltooligosaccharide transporter